METTITIKEMMLILLGGGGFVLLIYLVILVANLIKTMRQAQTIMKDVETITGIASKRTKDVDGLLEDVIKSASSIVSNLKGEVSLAKVGTAIVNLVTAVRGLIKSKGADDKEPKKEEKKEEAGDKKVKAAAKPKSTEDKKTTTTSKKKSVTPAKDSSITIQKGKSDE